MEDSGTFPLNGRHCVPESRRLSWTFSSKTTQQERLDAQEMYLKSLPAETEQHRVFVLARIPPREGIRDEYRSNNQHIH
jgi:hypothetical protein